MFGLFQKIEKKTGVKMSEILKLANSVQNANFRDEKTVRNLIRDVSKAANKSVSKEQEDQIVQTITKDPASLNFDTIGKMMDDKK
ncbi:stage VI sporulation protein F [Alkalihalobacillus sp. MEB130]|uniref:stage VI sporulation protein F n=1 Tax=Alkalihalobacillus sp. MEB130 TaxID=2976704 RepID=UPI0028DDAA4C|nr:stage VI sporulation protein F [Alkalihalobacillus sp. MEB130]MDT8859768.1 stage VI sporulation protein F [Alkalihalobacillus sp. MEB130]